MIAIAKATADFRQGPGGQLLGQVHRNLSWTRHGSRTARGIHFAELNVEVLGDLLLDLFDRDPAVVGFEQVVENVLHHFQRDRTTNQDGVRLDTVQRAFELSDVRRNLVREKFQHLGRNIQRDAFRFGLQDRQTQFIVGRVDIRDQTPAQTRLQPIF